MYVLLVNKHYYYILQFPGLPGEKGLVLLEDQMNAYYPRLFALWFPVSTRPFLITCHPETCKQVLKHTLQKPVKYGGYSGLIPWIGKDCFRIII